ncbi:MAG: hypothetical protein ACEPOV_11830 [Hyphomicrobiales bacterium]
MKTRLKSLGGRTVLSASFLGLILLLGGCKKDLYDVKPGNHSDVKSSMKTASIPTGYKDVQFGLGTQYDNGNYTGVAINRGGRIVEVHKAQTLGNIYFRVGSVDHNVISWTPSVKYDTGQTPGVAINDHNTVVEVHKTESPFVNGIYYHVGTHTGTTIEWGNGFQYDNGTTPQVALNNNNVVVEVHKSQGNYGLWYHVGIVDPVARTISWGNSYKYDGGGVNPSIAINNNNVAVEVHQAPTSGRIWYRVGHIDPNSKTISWGNSVDYQSGSQPDVALLDNGYVIEVHRSEGVKDNLWSTVGQVAGNNINWYRTSEYYDNGASPSVSANEELAIQTHDASRTTGVWASVSQITDRANWMYNTLSVIGNKKLSEITFPGSHDAGMYPSSLGQCQDKNFHEQLMAGIRFFDVRPNADMNVYHGPIGGPSVDELLTDVEEFMDEGHNELVILKFSHFKDFNSEVYSILVDKIKNKLGSHLYVNNDNKRLASITMNDYLSTGGKVLVLIEDEYAIENRHDGIYTYRDNYDANVNEGDIVFYDDYSNTTDYDRMRGDQLNKYYNYSGLSNDKENDMFLLSWTLTPMTGVGEASRPANGNLSIEMSKIMPNNYGHIPNVLYVDFGQLARVTDAAILMNARM